MEQGQVFSTAHPYYPRDVDLPDYVPNETPVPVILCSFGALLGIVQVAFYLIAKQYASTRLSTADRSIAHWFVLCGTLHCFFEGYFILNHEQLAASQSLFGQLWKEYALSDSRYLTSDPFMLSVEGITVLLWGPLSFLVAVLIVRGSLVQLPVQIVVCVAHLYGVLLYYSTCLVEEQLHGRSHVRPEWQYRWIYFVGLNLPWVVVPIYILQRSLHELVRIFRVMDNMLEQLEGADVVDEVEYEPKKDR